MKKSNLGIIKNFGRLKTQKLFYLLIFNLLKGKNEEELK